MRRRLHVKIGLPATSERRDPRVEVAPKDVISGFCGVKESSSRSRQQFPFESAKVRDKKPRRTFILPPL